MLLVADKGREEEVFRVFRKWGLDAVEIGNRDRRRHVARPAIMARSWPRFRTANWPTRRRSTTARTRCPTARAPIDAPAIAERQSGGGPDRASRLGRPLLKALDLAAVRPHGAHQHDCRVPAETPPSCASRRPVVRSPWRSTATAATRIFRPREGAKLAVAECCRNLSTVGALPVAATNCLNFGNPERPEIMAQLVEAIEGMAEACRFFDTPITGGNVSLYNETLGEGICPTPVLGIVGLMKTETPVTIDFKTPGRSVDPVGRNRFLRRDAVRLQPVRQGDPQAALGPAPRARHGLRETGAGSGPRDRGGGPCRIRARPERRRPGGGAGRIARSDRPGLAPS